MLATLGLCFAVATASAIATYKLLEPAPGQDDYSKGYKLGYAEAEKHHKDRLPKSCTHWWFGESPKVRYDKSIKAFCKGKDERKDTYSQAFQASLDAR